MIRSTLLTLLAVSITTTAHAAPADLDPLLGEYVLVDARASKSARNKGIERGIAKMNVLVRSIARGRIRDANPIPKTLSIARDGAAFTVAFDGRSRTATLAGPAIETKGTTGKPLKMTHHQRGPTLKQRFVGKDGGRENVMGFNAQGQLFVDVKVFSHRLPADVVYRLVFERE